MKIYELLEALKPSQYRTYVKGWNKDRYKELFLNSKYSHDRNGYRIFIPFSGIERQPTLSQKDKDLIGKVSDAIYAKGFKLGLTKEELMDNYLKGKVYDKRQAIKIDLFLKKKNPELYSEYSEHPTNSHTFEKVSSELESIGVHIGFNDQLNDLKQYLTGTVYKNTRQETSISKLLNDNPELQQQFVNHSIRQGKQESEYIAVISRHPYDIAGMSTDRGWTSCMNLGTEGIHGTMGPRYIPLDIEHGTLIAYAVSKSSAENNKDVLSRPTCRVLMKPFVRTDGEDIIYFGIEDQVYGQEVSGFTDIVLKWVNEINNQNGLKEVIKIGINPNVYNDSRYSSKFDSRLAFPKSFTEQEKEIFEIIEDDPYKLPKYIDQVAPEHQEMLQIRAVSNSGYVLKHLIKNPSEKVQMAAVRNDATVISYIENPSEKVQMAAIKNEMFAVLGSIDKFSDKVKQYGENKIIEWINGLNSTQLPFWTKIRDIMDWTDHPPLNIQKAIVKKCPIIALNHMKYILDDNIIEYAKQIMVKDLKSIITIPKEPDTDELQAFYNLYNNPKEIIDYLYTGHYIDNLQPENIEAYHILAVKMKSDIAMDYIDSEYYTENLMKLAIKLNPVNYWTIIRKNDRELPSKHIQKLAIDSVADSPFDTNYSSIIHIISNDLKEYARKKLDYLDS